MANPFSWAPLNPSHAWVAQICHEANRIYCASIGDLSQPTLPPSARGSRRSYKPCVARACW